MTKIDLIKSKLGSNSAKDTAEGINLLENLQRMNDDLLNFILAMKDKTDLIDALFAVEKYSQKQLGIIKKFITANLHDEDIIFKRELLEFALAQKIDGFWETCLSYLINSDSDEMLVFVSLIYLYSNMQTFDLPLIYSAFEKVLNSEHSYQNCQTAAAFFLYRMTFKQEYFDFLTAGIALNGGINREVLKNLLQEEYHQKPYFAAFDSLKKLLEDD